MVSDQSKVQSNIEEPVINCLFFLKVTGWTFFEGLKFYNHEI